MVNHVDEKKTMAETWRRHRAASRAIVAAMMAGLTAAGFDGMTPAFAD